MILFLNPGVTVSYMWEEKQMMDILDFFSTDLAILTNFDKDRMLKYCNNSTYLEV